MDPYLAVGQSIADGVYRGLDRRDKKKAIEQEYAQRMKLLQEQSRLDNEALTPEQKLMRMYQQNPGGFRDFAMAKDPMAGQEMAYKMGQLGVAQGNLNLDRQYRNWQMSQGGVAEPTSQMRNYQWLSRLPGMTQEKALQMLFRPDMMAQMMQMFGGMGGINPGGGGVPGGGGIGQ